MLRLVAFKKPRTACMTKVGGGLLHVFLDIGLVFLPPLPKVA
jgi:hypothetical protein